MPPPAIRVVDRIQDQADFGGPLTDAYVVYWDAGTGSFKTKAESGGSTPSWDATLAVGNTTTRAITAGAGTFGGRTVITADVINSNGDASLNVINPHSESFIAGMGVMAPNAAAGQRVGFNLGRNGATNNLATFAFRYVGDGSTSNAFDVFFYGRATPSLSVDVAGNLTAAAIRCTSLNTGDGSGTGGGDISTDGGDVNTHAGSLTTNGQKFIGLYTVATLPALADTGTTAYATNANYGGKTGALVTFNSTLGPWVTGDNAAVTT